MSQQKIAPLILLRIARRPVSRRAVHDQRLQVVGHRVAIGRVVIPILQPHPLAEFVADESLGEGDAGIEAAIVADLQHEARGRDGPPQRLRILRSWCPAASRPARACRRRWLAGSGGRETDRWWRRSPPRPADRPAFVHNRDRSPADRGSRPFCRPGRRPCRKSRTARHCGPCGRHRSGLSGRLAHSPKFRCGAVVFVFRSSVQLRVTRTDHGFKLDVS